MVAGWLLNERKSVEHVSHGKSVIPFLLFPFLPTRLEHK